MKGGAPCRKLPPAADGEQCDGQRSHPAEKAGERAQAGEADKEHESRCATGTPGSHRGDALTLTPIVFVDGNGEGVTGSAPAGGCNVVS